MKAGEAAKIAKEIVSSIDLDTLSIKWIELIPSTFLGIAVSKWLISFDMTLNEIIAAGVGISVILLNVVKLIEIIKKKKDGKKDN